MAGNSFGHLFRVTTWGESHGPEIGCVVDGVPPRIADHRGRYSALDGSAQTRSVALHDTAPGT